MAKYSTALKKTTEDAMQRKLRKEKQFKRAEELVNKNKKKRNMPKIGKQ